MLPLLITGVKKEGECLSEQAVALSSDAEAEEGADDSKLEGDDTVGANESQMSQDLTMDSVKIHLR